MCDTCSRDTGVVFSVFPVSWPVWNPFCCGQKPVSPTCSIPHVTSLSDPSGSSVRWASAYWSEASGHWKRTLGERFTTQAPGLWRVPLPMSAAPFLSDVGGSGGVGAKLTDITWMLCLIHYILGKETLASKTHISSCVSNSSFRAFSWTYPRYTLEPFEDTILKNRYQARALSST